VWNAGGAASTIAARRGSPARDSQSEP